MTRKGAILAVLATFGLIGSANKAEAGKFSIHLGIHPWVDPFSYHSRGDYSYHRLPRTEVVVRNCSDEPITVSVVDQSGRKRKEKKVLPVAAHATVRFVASSPNNSRVYRFIARNEDGEVVAEKEIYIYGRQWNWDELSVSR
jgi:hypothetical protein